MAPIPTVEMLRKEYEVQFGETLPAEAQASDGGPISLQRLKSKQTTTGLALSGGGIRSATFSLGVLQALAASRLLTSFDYLSTVSGGGYIGAWLSAWAHRHPSGIAGVMADLVPRVDRDSHEAAPIGHLRRYSNYLAPRAGLLSSDTWTIVGTYFRNLLVNWLSLIPYFALLLLVPMVGVDALQAVMKSPWIDAAVFGPLLTGGHLLVLASLGCLIVTMAVLGISLPSSTVPGSDSNRVALVARNQDEFLIKAMMPLLLGGVGLATAWFALTREVGGTLTLALPDLVGQIGLSNWQIFAVLGALAHVSAFTIYKGRSRWYTLTDSRRTLGLTGTTMLVQPVAVLGSGMFGGWVTWLAAGNIVPALMTAAAGGADPTMPTRVYVVAAVPLFLSAFVVGLALYTAMASRRMSEEDREWFARAGAWILAVAVGWTAVSGLALLGPTLLAWTWDRAGQWLVSIGGLSGLISMWLGGGGHTKAKDDREPQSWMSRVAEWALALAAPLFVLLLTVLLAAGVGALQVYIAGTWSLPMLTAAAAIAAGCVLVIGLVNWLVNVNVFSLHGMYRDRLVRAYLGASRANRQEHKFTGFDQDDNVPLAHLAPPFFNAETWPLVHTIATALRARPGDTDHEFFIRTDGKLLTDAVAVQSWSEERVLPIVNRFNAVLLHSKEAHTLRARLVALVQSDTAGAYGVHEWDKVRRIAAALRDGKTPDPSSPAQQLYTILAAEGEADWPRDVMNVGVWSMPEVTLLVARINSVIEAFAPARVGAAGELSAEVVEALRTSGIPVSQEELWKQLDKISPGVKPPFPIVNAAVNLVSGDDLAWQERQAASFTFTPLHAGSATVGFRTMIAGDGQKGCYGGTSGVSLGTAVSISGAAANPNMGHHSSPIVTVLLTLFNARLGAWLGNPQDEKRFSHTCPRNQFLPMPLTEALGLTHARGGYVHLSDGGHFENLGLYELVRRGCRHILLCDGGCDQQYAFEDLGNAVRKIRIDLGIEIDFEGFHVGPPRKGSAAAPTSPAEAGNYVAIGTIHYEKRAQGAKPGKLLYLKPAVLEKQEEPVDVWQYGRLNPAYPHESTTDQWFSESQFESYRALGDYIMRSVSNRARSQLKGDLTTVAELFDGVTQYLRAAGTPVATVPATPPK